MSHSFTLKDLPGASMQNDGVEYVTCPIEKAHTIRWEQLQFHLRKCIKSYQGQMSMLKHCPFDNTHLISVTEMVQHISECPKRGIFDSFKYNIGDTEVSADIPPPPVVPDLEDDWGNLNCPTYDKEKELEDRQILRKKIGAQPAERKQFKNQQRAKFNNF